MDRKADRRSIDGARLRVAALAAWLVIAASVIATGTDGMGRVVAVAGLALAVLAGHLLPGTWRPLAAGGLAGAATLAWLWVADAGPAMAALAALAVAATGLASVWTRQTATTGSPRSARQVAPAPAEARLPAGVADERLLDRLAVHEMTRARRYEHPLTLLLVDIDGWSAIAAERGRRGAFDVLAPLAVRIRRLLRDVDVIGLHGDGQLAILLPETPLDGALVVAGRIEEAAREDVGLHTRVGAAVFPEDAVSVDGLLREAEAALDLARLDGVRVAQRVQLHQPTF